MKSGDTIFALATVRGRAGVAVIRLSGPESVPTVAQICGKDLGAPRVMALRWLRDPDTGEKIDEALVVRFPEGQSFTGESVVELHTHGGPAIVDRMLDVLGRCRGLRPAEAGEFTYRALLNGRMDLSQVEGLADLINAETKEQQKQAVSLYEGQLSSQCATWRAQLLRAIALVEATIDFADEEVPEDVAPEVRALVAGLVADFSRELDGLALRSRVRDGFEVAIVGAPNVGKSTLLNALAGREVAITSDIAGTTRDVIEVRLDIAGHNVIVMDTAGLRETDDAIESVGVSRAIDRARAADLRVFLVEPNATGVEGLTPDAGDLVVRAKADLSAGEGPAVSGLTGEGVDTLLRDIETRVVSSGPSGTSIARARHGSAVRMARDRLVESLEMIDGQVYEAEILADGLREAVRAVESVVGVIDVEAVLGEIFSSFCIGK